MKHLIGVALLIALAFVLRFGMAAQLWDWTFNSHDTYTWCRCGSLRFGWLWQWRSDGRLFLRGNRFAAAPDLARHDCLKLILSTKLGSEGRDR